MAAMVTTGLLAVIWVYFGSLYLIHEARLARLTHAGAIISVCRTRSETASATTHNVNLGGLHLHFRAPQPSAPRANAAFTSRQRHVVADKRATDAAAGRSGTQSRNALHVGPRVGGHDQGPDI